MNIPTVNGCFMIYLFFLIALLDINFVSLLRFFCFIVSLLFLFPLHKYSVLF